MPGQHTEHAFETAIEHHLTTGGGYVAGNREGFDSHRAIQKSSRATARLNRSMGFGLPL